MGILVGGRLTGRVRRRGLSAEIEGQMSSAGDKVAAVAEVGLWVAAAALIAGAVGMRLPGGLLASSTATPGTSAVAIASPGASPTPTLTSSLAPTPSPAPTLSPLVRKFQAYLARKDFQFQATGTGSQSAVGVNLSVDLALTGSMAYKAGDEWDTTKMTSNGQTMTDDTTYAGSNKFERMNGGPWIKKPRKATDSRILFSPTRLFVDTGVETKNGTALHRLEVADPAALSAEIDALGIVTNSHLMLVFWTRADGTPAVFQMEGTWTQAVNGVQASVTTTEEFAFTKWAGVTISPPKSPWQWIVDGTDGIAFGLPSGWSKSNANNTLGLTEYVTASGQFDYKTYDAAGLTLELLVDGVIASAGDPVVGRAATSVGGQPAIRFGVHRATQKDYQVQTLAIYQGRVYQFLSFGPAGKDAATDAMAAQILATLEFTK